MGMAKHNHRECGRRTVRHAPRPFGRGCDVCEMPVDGLDDLCGRCRWEREGWIEARLGEGESFQRPVGEWLADQVVTPGEVKGESVVLTRRQRAKARRQLRG
jgi:hypothetical protein